MRLGRWAQEDLLLCAQELGFHPGGSSLKDFKQESDTVKSPTSNAYFPRYGIKTKITEGVPVVAQRKRI